MSSWPLLRILWGTQQNLASGCAHVSDLRAFREKTEQSNRFYALFLFI